MEYLGVEPYSTKLVAFFASFFYLQSNTGGRQPTSPVGDDGNSETVAHSRLSPHADLFPDRLGKPNRGEAARQQGFQFDRKISNPNLCFPKGSRLA